jgi:hypothetical protein
MRHFWLVCDVFDVLLGSDVHGSGTGLGWGYLGLLERVLAPLRLGVLEEPVVLPPALVFTG